jgi:hypothetical protein
MSSMIVQPLEKHYLRPMDRKCDYCHALHFIDEVSGATARMQFESYCKKGKVELDRLKEPLEYLRTLLTSYVLIEAISLRIFSSRNARRRFNRMHITYFSSVSPSSKGRRWENKYYNFPSSACRRYSIACVQGER